MMLVQKHKELVLSTYGAFVDDGRALQAFVVVANDPEPREEYEHHSQNDPDNCEVRKQRYEL